MTLLDNLREMERAREAYWLRYPNTSPVKLRWRAQTVRHWFHVLPGESLLDLGAGSGLWTEQLVNVLKNESQLTAGVFNLDLAEAAQARNMPKTEVRHVRRLEDLESESFDYVVGTAILCHDRYRENFRWLLRLLKPGGRLLFFEANYWNPQVLVKTTVAPIGLWAGNARCQVAMRRFRLMGELSQQGFIDVTITPYDIIHPRAPRKWIRALQSAAFVLEHAPLVREACGTLYIAAKKPGDEAGRRPRLSLARHRELASSTSVVVPCRNEAMNIPGLVNALTAAYDEYIREMIFVNDCSEDTTAEVVRTLSRSDARVRLIDREPPPGVGRALRDGYAAARGEFILSMDCDFRQIVPELRDLFDAVASGGDGAIGSRFSYDSILVNYPFAKILVNRGFHLLARRVLRRRLGLCRGRLGDISNNLKIYRANILRELEITRPDFAANVETGLKPILAGYDIKEVPISWINRTEEMGVSSFRLARLAPSYLLSLVQLLGWRPPETRP